MGMMTKLFGGEISDAITSKSEKLAAPTDAGAITPLNPGNFASIRTATIIEAPRYYSKEEADERKKLAKEKVEGARYTKKYLKATSQIEEADGAVHKAYRKHQKVVATVELTKKQADVGLAKHLLGLAPGYAKLGVGLEKAENRATERIEAIKAKLLGGAKE